MATYRLSDNKSISLTLFQNVTNSEELRKLAVSGQIDGALVSANKIVSPFHLLVAAYKAEQNQQNGKQTTKTLYSELLYCLSSEKSITGALKTFGIADKDEQIIVACIHDTATGEGEGGGSGREAKDGTEAICKRVMGEVVPLDRLPDFSNLPLIRKLYKVSEAELSTGSLEDAVVGRIAAKDFISF